MWEPTFSYGGTPGVLHRYPCPTWRGPTFRPNVSCLAALLAPVPGYVLASLEPACLNRARSDKTISHQTVFLQTTIHLSPNHNPLITKPQFTGMLFANCCPQTTFHVSIATRGFAAQQYAPDLQLKIDMCGRRFCNVVQND